MYKTIPEFIKNPPDIYSNRRQWFTLEFLEIYLRAGYTLIGDKLVSTLTASNFGVHDLKDAGKGHFKRLIVEIENEAKIAGYEFIKVENAQPELTSKLKKHGYLEANPEQTMFMNAHTMSKRLQQ
jgi:hypothetical protein